MKKIFALVLALAMMLSVTAVSFGEAAEAITYNNFAEHLNAFLSGINLQQKDLYMAAAVNEQSYQLLAGMNDEGVINLMAGQDQQEIGTLQFDSEAAYLSYQGSVMGIKFETIQNFINNLPQKMMQYLAQLGIDPQQLMADAQTLMGLYQNLLAKVQPAVQQSIDGDVVTITLDSENYAELYAEAIDEFLNDSSFQNILSRYLPLFGAQIDPQQIISGWQSARGEVVELIKKWQITVTVNNATGDFTMNSVIALPEDNTMVLNGNGNGNDDNASANFTVTVNQGETEIMREEISVNAEKTAPWIEYPNKFNETAVVYQNGQEMMAMNASYEFDSFMNPVSCLITMTQQGQEMLRAEYSDNTFVMYVQGQEMLFIQYKDGVFTMRSQGNELTLRQVEDDADHATFELTVTQNGEAMTVYIIASIADDGNGGEYLQIALTNGEQTPAVAQVLQTEKQAFSLLKDSATLNWITEEQLDGLFDNMVNSFLTQVQEQLGSGLDY